MTTAVTIDPGRHSATAWWRDGELRLVRRLELGHHARPDVLRCIDELREGATLLGVAPDVIVIEGQWMAPGRGGGFDRVAEIVMSRAAWTHAAEVIWGPPPEVVVAAPSTWMPALVGTKAGRVERVVELVRETYPGWASTWSADQVAAVGIGLWWWAGRGEEVR